MQFCSVRNQPHFFISDIGALVTFVFFSWMFQVFVPQNAGPGEGRVVAQITHFNFTSLIIHVQARGDCINIFTLIPRI